MGAAGTLRNTGCKLKERLGEARQQLIPGVSPAPSGIGKHTGKCFCGAVEVVATGDPLTMGYCHCTSCRQWSATPVNAYTIWAPEAVRITTGADSVGSFGKTKKTIRKWCQVCGGHLLTEHPWWLVTEVPVQ